MSYASHNPELYHEFQVKGVSEYLRKKLPMYFKDISKEGVTNYLEELSVPLADPKDPYRIDYALWLHLTDLAWREIGEAEVDYWAYQVDSA